MNLLVAGGAGFIGSNFCHRLERYGHRAVVVDALTYAGSREHIADIPDSILTFVHANIEDGAVMERIFDEGIPGKPFDAVINFAAESHVDRSIAEALPFVRSNVLGAVVLLEAARKARVPIFVQVSTDEVHGSTSNAAGFSPNDPLNPTSAYAASKAAADLLLQSFYKTHGYDVRLTRCTNNYGPFQHEEKFIPTIIASALAGRKIPVYGTGEQVRDWIYVDDHCDGIFRVLSNGRAGEIYHFSETNGASSTTNVELINVVLSELSLQTGKPLETYLQLVQHVADRPGHDSRYALEHRSSTDGLGWNPQVSLREGMKRTVAWYLNEFNARARRS